MVPLLGARMESLGLGGSSLGVVMAMFPLGRLLSSPLWGSAADRFRASGLLLRLGCGIALAGSLLLARARTAPEAVLGLLVFSVGRVPLGPLVDAVILELLSRPGADTRDYGRIRLWGSVGFLTLAVLSGWLHARAHVDPLALASALFALTWLGSFRFPLRGAGGPAPVGPAARALSRTPGLAPYLLFAALQALTLSVYDTFYSVHVHALGLPSWVTTWSVAAGVAVEVLMMARGRAVLSRLGPPRAMLLAALLAAPRWWLTATLRAPWALLLTQTLHGVTFALFWIALVQWMAERAPRELAASAQSLVSAVSYGLGSLVGALAAGRLRARFGTVALFEALSVTSLLAAGAAVLVALRTRPPELAAQPPEK